MDKIVYDCWYQGGASLLGQASCPSSLNGEPLQYKESRLVVDVTANYTPWFVLIILAVVLISQRERS